MARQVTTSARKTEIAERERKVMALRRAGVSFEDIGRQVGITHVGAYKIVARVLERTARETAEDAPTVRQMELDRLDAMLMGVWPRAVKGDAEAIRSTLAIMDRRAKYLGLDAPQRINIEHYVRALAATAGLDEDEALREAEAILTAARLTI